MFDEQVQSSVAVDPSSHKPTTYVPIWYIEQALQAVGVTNTWNGNAKVWNLTSQTSTTTSGGSNTSSSSGSGSSSATGGGSAPSSGVETQSAFVNGIFRVFATVGTMNGPNGGGYTPASVGIQATNDPVTAAQAAQFVYDWARPARDIGDNELGGADPAYSGFANAYDWATTEGTLFAGTSVTGPNSVISASDMPTILANLKKWLEGGVLRGNTYDFHFPMVPLYGIWQRDSGTHFFPTFQSELPEIIDVMKMMDTASITVANGKVIYNQTIPEGTVTLAPGIYSGISSNWWNTDKGWTSQGFNDHFPVTIPLVHGATELAMGINGTNAQFLKYMIYGLGVFNYQGKLENGQLVSFTQGLDLGDSIDQDYVEYAVESYAQ
ncbi:hypothetical protein [Alicyclobacillus acidocaldarius]|uniref:Uncharacterized protein n=1 Tax=Alicyclobacillus acidocaldarius subsp. acidocaldarius (strain ATCC 27009 / DSM 446 / BCRC 14685 / JCM 5260 / KCTC 1825 / NBRC 15652 / NCIMB 11725 / NRRL B-14509 / 104-IA) TaxID=521098 RepID=C8WWT4_ALIAD|nr:hypothetical protein [Alicyclobacillus acidocaldarius]ACV58556.1 hypothetical protein Aaci_1540 [Alicyclobacillus acidocaldarius subsp. acidocaldarius DSM 446]